MSKKKQLFLIDGSSFIFRAYHATERSRMSNSKGLPTNAIYVFTNMIQKLLRELKPDYLVMVWDAPGKTLREEKYTEYKATRKATPEPLLPQFEYIRKLVDAFKIAALEKEGYEADDVIATIAEQYRGQKDMEVVIVSGDKDMGQLLDANITMLDTMKEKETTPETILEKWGLKPTQLIDLFALLGDTSDNVPGVKGIGDKSAPGLVAQFGSLDGIYQNLDKVPENIRAKLEAQKEQAYLSRELIELEKKVPLEFKLDDFKIPEPDREKLAELFRELEFHKLLSEYSRQSAAVNREAYQLVTQSAELEKLARELEQKGLFAFDIETTSKDPMKAEPVGFSFATAEGRAFYLPFGHRGVLGQDQLSQKQVFDLIQPLLESEKIKKIGQNIKYDYSVLKLAGLEPAGYHFDTMIASYLLNPRRRTHNLTDLALEHFGHKMITFQDIAGKGKNQKLFSEIDLDTACKYSGEDADITLRLFHKFAPELKENGLDRLYYELELPLATVLARMQMHGVKIDGSKLSALSKELSAREETIKKEIFEIAKGEFNIDSPKQLSEVLFSRLNLPTKKKTKTGFSTNVDVLNELAAIHPLPKKIIEYRTLAKLRSTYTDALVALIDPKTGRLHTSYNQTVTSTGRLSSSDPNLQNIPTRTPEGRKIREVFIAEKGFSLLSADYSQIELRVLAHLSGEPALLESFEKGEDIHRRTAMEVFGVKADQVNSELRRRAKVINFGVLYGMSDFGLSQELNIDVREAKTYIEHYFERYPRVREFLDEVLAEAREKMAIRTLLGRLCRFPDINSDNQIIRKAAEREAINAPMQGSAADIIKVAMIKIDRLLDERKMKSRMIMQVHDELVFEAADAELEELKKLVTREMESAAQLKVPLKVDLGVGHNWVEAH